MKCRDNLSVGICVELLGRGRYAVLARYAHDTAAAAWVYRGTLLIA